MKKRIIASILVVVMLALALVGCGSFNFAEENLSNYVTDFNYAAFMSELKNIEIEDGDFTTDEDTRKEKVAEAIYAAMADTKIAEAEKFEADRLEVGAVGDRDVLYFCYYATDDDGNVFFFSNMKEASITASSTKAKHVVELGSFDEDDEFIAKIAEAVKGFDFGENGENVYSMLTAAYLDDTKVTDGNVIVVSYDRTYNTYKEDGTTIDKTYKESAAFDKITVSAESDKALGKKLAELVAGEGNTVKVGTTVKVKTGESTTSTSFTVVDNGVTYTYSNVTIQWKEDKAGSPVTFKYQPYASDASEASSKVKPDNCVASDKKVDLRKELTYHVFPVYRISIPAEITAANILRYVFGDDISTTSLEILASEEYKNGGKTVKALVEALVKVYDEKYESGSDLAKLLDAYNKAKKAVKDAGDDVTEEQEKAEKDTHVAYVNAQRAEIDATITKIVEATSGDKTLAEKVVEEHEKETYHELEEKYNTYITETVEKAVYDLLFNNDDIIKVVAYPEDLVKEFKDHLYESYEYEYYKGTDATSKKSNYSQYDSLEAYLVKATKASNADGIDAAIEKEAKAAIAPLLKLYAAAKVFAEKGAADATVDYIWDDIDAGAYDATYEDDADEKTKREAEKAAKEQREQALESAKDFLITDEVFGEYKKSLGSAAYRQYEKEYGEINIRASLQFNKLFYYLTSARLEVDEDDEHAHAHVRYKSVADDEGNYSKVVWFRLVEYSVKADDAK